MIYQRAREAIAAGGDPEAALRTDQGIRSILESTAAYGRNVTYAAVVDNEGRAIAHSFPAAEGQKIEAGENLAAVLDGGTLAQIRTIYADRALEVVLPLELGDAPFGAIRVGLSPVLIRDDLTKALRPMLLTTALLSGAAILVGLVLATPHPSPHSRHQQRPDEAGTRRKGRQHRPAARRRARGRRGIVPGHQREAGGALARPPDGRRDARSPKPAERHDDPSRAGARAPAAGCSATRARRSAPSWGSKAARNRRPR